MKATRRPGRSTRRNSAKARVEVGQVVQHRVAEHEVERLVLERQLLGVAGHGLDLQPQLRGASARSASSMPGEMSVAVASPTTPARSRLSVK